MKQLPFSGAKFSFLTVQQDAFFLLRDKMVVKTAEEAKSSDVLEEEW